MNAEPPAEPWALAAEKRLADLLEMVVNRADGKCEWRRFSCDITEVERLAAAAWIIAEEIIRLRCNTAHDLAALWVEAAKGNPPRRPDVKEQIRPFVEPSFGLPPTGIDPNHGQGHIAEIVWRILAKEQERPGRTLVHLARPDPDAQSPGSDGFAIYAQDDGYHFRLWEIKKRAGGGTVSPTISTAYTQLTAKADRYLAKVTAMSAVKDGDPLAETFGQLVPRWKSGHPTGGVGVAVAVDAAALPKSAFTTMHERFPKQAKNPGTLEGCLIGLGDYADFCFQVRGLLWNGL